MESNTNTPIETKASRVFKALMRGNSYNRFDAERMLNDHCLHSTVSALQKRHGITITRHSETVPGYQGISTQVCRYYIVSEERERIKEKTKEKAPTINDQENNTGLSNHHG